MRGTAYRIGPPPAPAYRLEPRPSVGAGFWVVMLFVAIVALVADRLSARGVQQAQAAHQAAQARLDSVRAQ